jgi:hypothetical protein
VNDNGVTPVDPGNVREPGSDHFVAPSQ